MYTTSTQKEDTEMAGKFYVSMTMFMGWGFVQLLVNIRENLAGVIG